MYNQQLLVSGCARFQDSPAGLQQGLKLILLQLSQTFHSSCSAQVGFCVFLQTDISISSFCLWWFTMPEVTLGIG